MAVKNVTELDFTSIKNNLKTFLKNQDEFADYNFEASGISTLIDLLAYNTHYNAVLAHMVSNEAFLDSAVRRNSVVSIAKTMGYTPRSARSAKATIDLTVVPATTYTSTSLTLPKDKTFQASVDNVARDFVPDKDYTVAKTIVDGVAAFRFTDIVLAEGLRTTTSEIISSQNRSGPIVLENDGVDTTSITVKVQTSTTNAASEVYSLAEDTLNVTSTSKVFYLEERTDGYYQINFGDGVLGKQLEVGNIVIVDYIACNGAAGNGARQFFLPTNLTGLGENTSGSTKSASASGFNKETADSIRFNAPRFNAAKNRVITKGDYEAVIKQSNPNIKSVAAWGGEDNLPPIYGKVFISLQPNAGYTITQADKDTISNTTLEPKMPVGLVPEFVDPEFVHIGLNAVVTYDTKLTTLTTGSLGALVTTKIEDYFSTNLNELKKNFYHSRLQNDIAKLSDSIIGVNLEMRLIKKLTPTLGSSARYEPKFNNKIMPNAIRSNFFIANLNGSRSEVYLADKPNSDVTAPVYSGQGVLQLKTKSKGVVVADNIGTVDYDTGVLDIVSLNITEISGVSNDELRVVATPHESSRNISTDILVRTTEEQSYAVFAQPSRNIILNLDDAAEDSVNNIRKGLNVQMVERIVDE